jgi:hypothetical protein
MKPSLSVSVEPNRVRNFASSSAAIAQPPLVPEAEVALDTLPVSLVFEFQAGVLLVFFTLVGGKWPLKVGIAGCPE